MKPVLDLLRQRAPSIRQIGPDTTVFEALQVLADYEVGALLVMDAGRLVGVFSERDYTRKVALQGRNSRDTPVSDIMSTELVTVAPDTRTSVCMALMSQHKIRHLPVLDGTRVVGMLSIRDLLDDLIADQEQTISQLQHYISS